MIDLTAWSGELAKIKKTLDESRAMLREMPKVDIGSSPRAVIYQRDLITVYRYRPLQKKQCQTPLLITFALVNRPEILDLSEQRSFIRALLKSGIDVYLLDWGSPTAAHRDVSFADYVCRFLPDAVQAMRAYTGIEQFNMLGVCQGGVLSMCYASLFPEKIKNLVTMVTPVDFSTSDNSLAHLYQHIDIAALVREQGNISHQWVINSFASLKPFQWMGLKYLDFCDRLTESEQLMDFLRMERWLYDGPDLAAKLFLEYTMWLYQQNLLAKGQLILGDQQIDLRNLTMPLLNVYSTNDHIVPPSASKPLKNLVGSQDYSEYEFPGGHVSVYVSELAKQTVMPKVIEWLAEHD